MHEISFQVTNCCVIMSLYKGSVLVGRSEESYIVQTLSWYEKAVIAFPTKSSAVCGEFIA